MSTQERIEKAADVRETKEQAARRQAEEDAVRQAQEKPEADLTLTDELLDEIDGLLEENAQEFVANYIQKGGQ